MDIFWCGIQSAKKLTGISLISLFLFGIVSEEFTMDMDAISSNLNIINILTMAAFLLSFLAITFVKLMKKDIKAAGHFGYLAMLSAISPLLIVFPGLPDNLSDTNIGFLGSIFMFAGSLLLWAVIKFFSCVECDLKNNPEKWQV